MNTFSHVAASLVLDTGQRAARDLVLTAPPGADITIAGGGGVGKTALLSAVVADLRAARVAFIVCAPTNRACRVLISRGVYARTLHSVVYHPKPTPEAEFDTLSEAHTALMQQLPRDDTAITAIARRIQELLEPSFTPAESNDGVACVLVDESSMVSHEMYSDLRKAVGSAAVIVSIGDQAQLPPVSTARSPQTQRFQTLAPDIILTRQHRFDVAGYDPALFADSLLTTGALRGAGAGVFVRDTVPGNAPIICATNKMRNRIGRWRHRQIHPGAMLPPTFELVSLVTHSAMQISSGDALEVAFDGPVDVSKINPAVPVLTARVRNLDALETVFKPRRLWLGDIHETLTGQRAITWRPAPAPGAKKQPPIAVSLPYCRTVHHAQGSEWPFVCVSLDILRHGRWLPPERRALIYTALTRPRQGLSFLPTALPGVV